MGQNDIVSKRVLKNLLRDFAVHLFGLPVTEVELLETQTQRVEERRSDLVAKARLPDGETFILHCESQTGNETAMPYRMLRYLSDILLEYPGLPVRQYLVYIGAKPLTMADGFDMPRFSYRYDIIDLHTVDGAELLARDSPDAWVLAVLCDFKGLLAREVVHTILARLKARYAEDPARLRDYLEMLEVLASNRDLNIDIREELDMLTIDVEKLASFQMGQDKGREEGAHAQAVLIAGNLLGIGLTAGQVAAATGLPLAEVEALAQPQGDA